MTERYEGPERIVDNKNVVVKIVERNDELLFRYQIILV